MAAAEPEYEKLKVRVTTSIGCVIDLNLKTKWNAICPLCAKQHPGDTRLAVQRWLAKHLDAEHQANQKALF